jgi:hypothetical protein
MDPVLAAVCVGRSILTWIIVVKVSRRAGSSTTVKFPISVPDKKTTTVVASALSMNFKEHNHNKQHHSYTC